MRRNFLLAVVLWASAVVTPSTAQEAIGNITARVKDPQGAMIARAKVSLFTRDGLVRLSVMTDESGEYRFLRLAAGVYFITAEAPGFSRAEVRTTSLPRGGSVTVDFSLELAALREKVVVTASGSAQTVDQVSKAITVVEDKEIEARNEFAITEALRPVPGVRVQQLGGPGAFVSIKMRGLRSEDTAILLDGFRFRDAASTQGDASALLESLVVTDLERIEVLRGSGSSLYGTNAIGGVVNIVTAEGGGPPRGTLFLEGGSLNFFRGRARIAGGFDEDRVTYSLGLTHLNVGEGLDGDDDARNTSVQGQIRWRPSTSTTLSARLYTADAFAKVNETPLSVGAIPPTGIIEAVPLSASETNRFEEGVSTPGLDLRGANFVPSANDPDSTRDTRFVSAGLNFEHKLSETFGYSLAYHGLITDRAFKDGPQGVSFEPTRETLSEFDGRVHTFYATADLEVGSWNFFTAGFEFESETFINFSFPADPTENSSVDVTQTSNTFFIQDQLSFLEGALQVSGAFRAQFFSLDDPVFAPAESAPYAGVQIENPPRALTGDGSVAYFFRSSGTKLRAHIGNGYRAPSLFERFGTFFSTFGYSIFGDPRLEPERSLGYDIGVDQVLFHQRVSVSATFFDTRLKQVVVFDFTGAIDPFTDPFGRFGGYRSVDGGSASGLELGSAVSPTDSLHFALAYTFTDTEPPAGGDEALTQAFIIPKHQFSVVATQYLARDFYINFELNASDGYFAPVFDPVTFVSRTYRFGGIVKADLGASYTLPLGGARGVRVFGKVENLFDHENLESGYRTPGRTAVVGAAYQF